MKLCATVAEFNPFHNGHGYLINNFKGNFDATVAIMSGNFVQRGDVAVFNKFHRANEAVRNGVDVVIELPVIYALSSAETFAEGAVKTLNALNSIDTLFFGSEEGSIEPLMKAAELSLNECEDFTQVLKRELSKGLSYPKAMNEAYKASGIIEEIISSPNKILGIEYIKALIKTASSITPATTKRIGAEHDSSTASGSVASASHLRALIGEGKSVSDYMPQGTNPSPVFGQSFSHIILYTLKTATYEYLTSIPDCSPDLAARFIEASRYNSLEETIKHVKSKNFTESRIRRILWNAVIRNNIPPKTDPSYIRILAQSKRGGEVINFFKENSSLPVIQKGVQLKDNPVFLTEARATDIYNIIANLPSGADFRHSPIPI